MSKNIAERIANAVVFRIRGDLHRSRANPASWPCTSATNLKKISTGTEIVLCSAVSSQTFRAWLRETLNVRTFKVIADSTGI